MNTTAYLLSFFCLILNICLFIRLKPPYSFYFVMVQLAATALSPFLIILGSAGAVLGWFSQAWVAFAAGIIGASISLVYILLVTLSRHGFNEAFGECWSSQSSASQASSPARKQRQIVSHKPLDPHFTKNVAFWRMAGSDRELLCDIWEPSSDTKRSGLAFIYLHGSAWYLSDKDFGTRPMFNQLTAQGHVIMDVAYRLVPEVDIFGMIGDVKRAIVWMKDNADHYGVNPERIILAGGSAGGHLALLAAYTPGILELTPAELADRDLSVRAVISLYGPTDLHACYEHLHLERTIGMPKLDIGQPGAATMKKTMTDAGRLDTLLGGHLHEVPEMYALASPVTYVNASSPPTLLIQGEPDVISPVKAVRELHDRLVNHGVPVVNIIYPLTNHPFDLILPQVSPAAQKALFEIKRFLALMI